MMQNVPPSPFTPSCHDCGATAEGAHLESFIDGVAKMKYLCRTCGPGLGGWATTVQNSHHWIVLRNPERGIYFMRRANPDKMVLE